MLYAIISIDSDNNAKRYYVINYKYLLKSSRYYHRKHTRVDLYIHRMIEFVAGCHLLTFQTVSFRELEK